MPPDVRLADAPRLQALHEPSPHLDVVPRHVLQQVAPRAWPARLRGLVGDGGGAVLVHVALGAAFFYLLSFRETETPREIEIPVEVVRETPKSPPALTGTGGQGGGAPTATGPVADPTKASAPGVPPSAPPGTKAPGPSAEARSASKLSAPSAPPPPPPPEPKGAGKSGSPPAPPRQPQPQPEPGEAAAPKLVAPPPDAAKAATQDRENKPANLVPDERQLDQATREARPAAVPRVLVTGDAKAATAVPVPAKPVPVPADKPAPPIPVKVPSAADKLAAALPMDAASMPMGFRSVLAGNAVAQINAAYQGVVQGRIQQSQAELARTAYAQHMSGNVAVAFTIDDAGHLSGLTVVQSSGDPQLDALALHVIELAAPFPPPPPEAEHTFKKAFLVGG